MHNDVNRTTNYISGTGEGIREVLEVSEPARVSRFGPFFSEQGCILTNGVAQSVAEQLETRHFMLVTQDPSVVAFQQVPQ